MQLKRQSIEAWQNEKHYSKGNNTSENPILRQEIFKQVDRVKYEGQVRSQHLLLSFQAVMLLSTKTAINHWFFFQSSLR